MCSETARGSRSGIEARGVVIGLHAVLWVETCCILAKAI